MTRARVASLLAAAFALAAPACTRPSGDAAPAATSVSETPAPSAAAPSSPAPPAPSASGSTAAVTAVVPSPSVARDAPRAPAVSFDGGSASAPSPGASHAAVPASVASAASSGLASKPVSVHLGADHYAIDLTAPGDCRANQECSATIRLQALAEYHVNDEYPYKFIASAAPQIQFLGTDGAGPAVFSKAAGDFRAESHTIGTLRVRFKPAASGPLTVSGTYKMSVCSEANCQVEQPKLSITVPVM